MASILTQIPDIARDAIATFVAFCGALSWLALVNHAASEGWLPPTLSRKVIHIGTGPLFVASWLLYSSADHARYLAALVPLILTARFLFTGLGWVENQNLVKSSTRSGVPGELLRGPLYYGIGFIICTLLFWRNSPSGILALMMMCGGDGLADIVGRRFGTQKLPFSPEKSWAGSLAMLAGSVSFGFGYLLAFNQLGLIQFSFPLNIVFVRVGAIALLATFIEALPVPDIDNLTLTISVVVLSQWLLY